MADGNQRECEARAEILQGDRLWRVAHEADVLLFLSFFTPPSRVDSQPRR